MNDIMKTGKVVIGSTLAIWIARCFGLEFAASAGIIALLTIQNTRLETFRLATQRFYSFMLTMVTAWIIQTLSGFIMEAGIIHHDMTMQMLGFGLFMLVVVGVSYSRGWDGSISTNAVFGTHIFVFVKAVTLHFTMNELGILIIGTTMAVLLNLKMPDKEREVREGLTKVENEFKAIFMELSEHLSSKKELKITKSRLISLMENLDIYTNMAIQNRDNTMKDHSEFYIHYFVMRKNQAVILLHMCKNFMFVESPSYRSFQMSDFLMNMAETFTVRNNAAVRMAALGELMLEFWDLPLPQTKEEFETHAVLFHELKELEEFLKLKQIFYEGLTEEQKKMYMKM